MAHGSRPLLNCELVFRTKACGWPVFEAHAKTQTVTLKDFLDFCERLLAKVRRAKQLDFRTLYEIADVHDVFCFQAVGRSNGQFKLVNRAQQNRINLAFCQLTVTLFLALQVNEYRQLILEDAARAPNCFFRINRAIGFNVDDQLVEVSALFYACRLRSARPGAPQCLGQESRAADYGVRYESA